MERQQTNKRRILKNSDMSFCRCLATGGKQTAVAQITTLQNVKKAQPMLVVLYWPLLNSLLTKESLHWTGSGVWILIELHFLSAHPQNPQLYLTSLRPHLISTKKS